MLIKKNLEDFSMQKANETNTVYFSHFYLAKQKKCDSLRQQFWNLKIKH